MTYNAVAGDRGKYFHYTGAGGVDFTLTAAATLTSTWSCFLRNDAAGNITINPDGGELINGAATLAIEPGVCVEIFCSGTEFFTLGQASAVDGANIQLSNLGTTSINAALLPSADNTRDLGTTALGWRDIYARTVVSPVTGGIIMAVWDTGTNTYKSILGGIVGNPATAVIADFVTGTTQPPGTNTAQLATCAFVLANAGSSGGWVLLATVTAAATTNIDFTTNINSTYDEYRILASNVKNATSGTDLQMRISIAASFQTGAFYNYAYGYWSNAGANATGSATGTFAIMSISGIGISTSSNRVYGFDFALKNPADTASYKVCKWSLGYSRVTTEISQVTDGISVFTNSAAAIDGVRFFNASGAVTSGVYYLYGIKK